jgi:hypothetical protein
MFDSFCLWVRGATLGLKPVSLGSDYGVLMEKNFAGIFSEIIFEKSADCAQ